MASSIGEKSSQDLYAYYQEHKASTLESARRANTDQEIELMFIKQIGLTKAILELSGYDSQKLTEIFTQIFTTSVQPVFNGDIKAPFHSLAQGKKVTVIYNGDGYFSSTKCRLCPRQLNGCLIFQLKNDGGTVSLNSNLAHRISEHRFYGLVENDVHPLDLATVLYAAAGIEKESKAASELYLEHRKHLYEETVGKTEDETQKILTRHMTYTNTLLELNYFSTEWIRITLLGLFMTCVLQVLEGLKESPFESLSPYQKITVIDLKKASSESLKCHHCGCEILSNRSFSLHNAGGSIDLDEAQIHFISKHDDYGLTEKDPNPFELARILYATADLKDAIH